MEARDAVPHCAVHRQPPQQRMIQPQMSTVPKLKTPALLQQLMPCILILNFKSSKVDHELLSGRDIVAFVSVLPALAGAWPIADAQ